MSEVGSSEGTVRRRQRSVKETREARRRIGNATSNEPTASGHDLGDNKISESAGRCRNSGYVTGTTPLHSTEGRVPSRRGG